MFFPNIPNVEFKIIAGNQSGNREYAISSDGRVWIGHGNRWDELKPYQTSTGEWAVMLQFGGPLEGASRRVINELLYEYFGVNRS